MLPDGRRQILDFLIPGDVIALPDLQMTAIGYSVEAMTSLSLCVFPARRLRRLVEDNRDIFCGLWAVERYNQNRLLEHFASIGRRNALERLAHLLLEIHYRLTDRGLAGEKAFLFPASQYEIGDAINLTNAHVSRLFRRLKDDGIAEISCGQVVLHARKRLCELCGFDDAYLCLDCLRAAHNAA
jgi:CRP-like cAMP-binding protein